MEEQTEQPVSPDPDAYLSLAQAALLAGVTRTGLLRRIQSGRLRHLRIGHTYAVTLRWIAESEEPSPMGRPPKRLPEHLRPAPGRPKPPRPTRRKGDDRLTAPQPPEGAGG